MSLVGYFSVDRDGKRQDGGVRELMKVHAALVMRPADKQTAAEVYRREEDYDPVLRSHLRL